MAGYQTGRCVLGSWVGRGIVCNGTEDQFVVTGACRRLDRTGEHLEVWEKAVRTKHKPRSAGGEEMGAQGRGTYWKAFSGFAV